MSELFMGILTNKDIIELNKQGYNPYNQTRVDRYIMRYYLSNGNGDKIYYHCFEPSNYGLETLSNQTQTNERSKIMNELQKRLQAMKAAKSNNTNEIKKGIIADQTNLTLQKFTALENLSKKFDCFEIVLSKQAEKINNVYMDNASLIKQVKSLSDMIIENNQLLVNIANQLSKKSTIQTVKIKDTKKDMERENVIIDNAGIDYPTFYNLFMDCLQKGNSKRNFAQSNKKDKLQPFIDMIKALNFNDIDTLDDQLKEYSGKVDKQPLYGVTSFNLYGRPIKDEIKKALIEAWNKLNNTTATIPIKDNGVVYSKKYFLNYYKAQEVDFDAIIDMIKTNGFDDTMEGIIADYLSNPENNLVNWEDENTYDKLISWFKAFAK